MTKVNPEETYQNFLRDQQTVQLATIDEQGMPQISYALFVRDESSGAMYIFVSQLAAHTRHLLQHPKAAVLMIEDEQDTRQIFARKRASFDCIANVIKQDDPQYTEILNVMETRFGNVVELLRSLPDFVLFELQSQSGQFVMGFGKAYRLTGESLSQLEHISA